MFTLFTTILGSFNPLLGFLSKIPGWISSLVAALPNSVRVALIVAAVFGVRELQHKHQVHGLQSNVASLTQTVASQETRITDLTLGITESERSVSVLRMQLIQQNASIISLSSKKAEAEARAATLARQALLATSKQADNLRQSTSPIPPGHVAINRWLQDRFTRQ